MLGLITLIVVGVAVAGYLKELTPEERAISVKYAKNYMVLAFVYLWRGIKALFSLSFHAGRYAGATMAKEGQTTLRAMAEKNKEFESEGGAIKAGVRISEAHAKATGLEGLPARMKEKADKESAELAQLRAELAAI